jgi:hypothetical protein
LTSLTTTGGPSAAGTVNRLMKKYQAIFKNVKNKQWQQNNLAPIG